MLLDGKTLRAPYCLYLAKQYLTEQYWANIGTILTDQYWHNVGCPTWDQCWIYLGCPSLLLGGEPLRAPYCFYLAKQCLTEQYWANIGTILTDQYCHNVVCPTWDQCWIYLGCPSLLLGGEPLRAPYCFYLAKQYLT